MHRHLVQVLVAFSMTVSSNAMPEESPNVCPSCGAHVPEGKDFCDLCGTSLSDADASRADAAASPGAGAGGSVSAENNGPYCNQCGWQNPSGARYCSQCGARLQEVSGAAAQAGQTQRPPQVKPAGLHAEGPGEQEMPAESASADEVEDEQKDITKQVGILVGASLLLVVAMFLFLVYDSEPGGGASQEGGGPARAQMPPAEQRAASQAASIPEDPAALREQEPLPEDVANRVDDLKSQMEEASGEGKQSLQSQLINLYLGSGRRDLAAVEQESFAEQTGRVEDWERAGHLFYDWMQTIRGTQQQGRRVGVAQRAIDAYQRVLEEQPDNVDVRTDMATAYVWGTNQPMQGVQQIKQVLEQDPDHVEARFNYGIMLAMIGRTDQAIQQLERVRKIAGEDSPHYQRAGEIIQRIRQQGTGSSATG